MITWHGVLMVCGFLGVVIGVERAAALGSRWALAGPACAAAGSATLLLGGNDLVAQFLFAASAIGLVAVNGLLLQRQSGFEVQLMLAGALSWLVGIVVWVVLGLGGAIAWWIAFPVLTIAAERLELARILQYSSRVRALFQLVVGLLGLGLVLRFVDPARGDLMIGLSLAGLALWLIRNDVARRTVRRTGLARYIAVALLGGYLWLGIGGILLARFGLGSAANDAILHALFVGFVISLVFGHAPITGPALGAPLAYHPAFYGPIVVIQTSVLLRVTGDLAGLPAFKVAGSVGNALAIMLFLVTVVGTMIAARVGKNQRITSLPARPLAR